MALSPLFTDAQLETACGGADRLLQLSRAIDGADQLYATFKAEVRAAAQADAYGLAKIAVDPLDPNVPASGLLQQYAVTCGVFWAHHKGTGGLEVPPPVDAARRDAIEALKELRDGGRTLDIGVDPRSASGVKTVDTDPPGTRVLRKNLGGFC